MSEWKSKKKSVVDSVPFASMKKRKSHSMSVDDQSSEDTVGVAKASKLSTGYSLRKVKKTQPAKDEDHTVSKLVLEEVTDQEEESPKEIQQEEEETPKMVQAQKDEEKSLKKTPRIQEEDEETPKKKVKKVKKVKREEEDEKEIPKKRKRVHEEVTS